MKNKKEFDGFQSDQEGEVAEVQQNHHQYTSQANDFLNNLILKDIDPPQQIKTKTYSLQPDITTGWAPKIVLPKPIHLTYPDFFLKSLLDKYFKQHPNNIELCYLGPRYDNTYSAWKYLNLQFPYKHLNSRKLVLSDRKFVGNHPNLHENSLQFNSMFESGNLDAAFKVNQYQYDCFMRIDVNTRGHLQWYYFQVSNLKKNQQYRINICNFQKSKSLYSRGMRPYIVSKIGKQFNGQNWKQTGEILAYSKQKSLIQRILNVDSDQQYFQLSFTISTKYDSDTLLLAYCPPYTYTNLLQYLYLLSNKHSKKDIIYEEQISNTLSGLPIPIVTITNHVHQEFLQSKNAKPIKNKRLIFIMGRIHPGQSNSSFMVQGLINWICNNSMQSNELRQKFIFKILPMVNPDGVIIGNYRTGLSGRDFNRQFIDPDKSLFVEINAIKQFVYKYKKIYQGSFTHFLDFHGHTIKKNIFTYGPQFPITNTKYYECRILPKLISKKTTLFRYFSCKFNVAKSKQSTARAVLIRQFYIPYSYTIESSNGFYVDIENNSVEFTTQKWIQAGEKICQSLYDYIVILKAIELKRQERKKQKEVKNKNKIQKYKKYNSFTKTTQFNIQNTKSKKYIKQDQFQEDKKAQSAFENIINELKMQIIENQHCSDDELSQGKSDSENSKDDINFDKLKSSIFVHNEQKISKTRISQNHLKVIRIIKRNTINSDFQNKNEEKKQFQYMRPRKSAVLRKKLQSISCTPSPVKGEGCNTAKIININFQLNPVQTSFYGLIPDQRTKKMRTEMGMMEVYENRNYRNDRSDSFRRTFISLHREVIKKDSNKKIKNNYSTLKNCLKVKEIVGKRIFTQTIY